MSHTVSKTPALAEFPPLQLVRTSRSIRLFGRCTLTLLTLFLLALIVAPWRQSAKGNGVVMALDPQERPQPVLSPSKGIVSYVKPGLREGSFVEKGDVLLRLTPFAVDAVTQFDTQIAAIESKQAAATASLEVAKQAAELQRSSGQSLEQSLRQSYLAAHQKWEQSKNDVTALQAELEDKRNQLRIANEVAGKGLISREELFSKQQAVESQLAKMLKGENAVEEAYASLMSKEDEIESKVHEIDIKNRTANQKVLEEMQKINTIEKELLDLQNKRSELDRMEIRAPRSGHIQQWFGLEGSDTIKEGDQLFIIVPEASSMAVELKVSGNDLPLLKEGDRVRLQFEGWPAVQFVGWPSVAVGTFGGTVNRIYPTDDGKGNFRVVVTPESNISSENDWPNRRYLRQGVRAHGWILLRQVSLGYELWRQLNGFPPTVADDEPSKTKSKDAKPKLPK